MCPAPKSESLLVRGATLVTVDDENRVFQGDLKIVDGRIVELGSKLSAKGIDRVIKGKGLVAMPGFVQAHIHLCQTLFRGQADDMELLTWLSSRIWPMEAALSEADLRASARLGLAEVLLAGTTSILDMGTVNHSHVLFEEAKRFGIRYTGGKCMMDQGHGFPAALRQSTEDALNESIELCERFHGTQDGRLRYAFAPRFVLSCSEELMKATVVAARERGALLHTHSSENAEEVEIVRDRTGMGNVEYLDSIGFSGPDVLLAHGIWLSPKERAILRETKTRIVHCPSANLKLASGIARIAEMMDQGVSLALGADGAACNNNLDPFVEMRFAALLHKVRSGPTAVPAARALRLATRDGAEALGLEDVGFLAEGKRADLVLLDLNKPHAVPELADPVSRIVYSARASDVHTVIVDGRVVVDEGELVPLSQKGILKGANQAAERVRKATS